MPPFYEDFLPSVLPLFASCCAGFATDFQFRPAESGSKVPAFAHPHAILSSYSLARDRKRERMGGEERRKKPLNVERPLVATLRLFTFTLLSIIVLRKRKRETAEKKGKS